MSWEPIQEMFRQVAERSREQVAVEGEPGEVTYGWLDEESNRLANLLRARGVAAGSRVAILCRERSRLIAAILASLKGGFVFVPLDPGFPQARLEAMVLEVEPACWIVERDLAGRVCGQPDLGFVVLEAEDEGPREAAAPFLEGPADPDGMCSIYFTSGSTGRPKAIAGRLKGIDHFIRWERELLGVGEGVRVSQLTSPAFDASLRDVFLPLCSGGVACTPPDRETVLDPRALADWLERSRVEVVHCVPSLLRGLLGERLHGERFPALRWVVLAGERLLPEDVRRWTERFGERVRLVNLYGATETTMTKLFHRVSPADGQRTTVPVGKPMPGARAVVLDEQGRVCPPGAVGEIHVRTPYRSLGYFNRPDLTREVFVPNPLTGNPDDLVYRTGDFGRMLENGDFELVGRRDHQVKIRGARVELGEVENALRRHGAVGDLAVVDGPDARGETRLVAYLVLEGEGAPGELRRFCAEQLPDYMVPSVFVPVAAIPRTFNGKLDRAALPAPADRGEAGRTGRMPQGAVEELLAEIWGDLLGLETVGAEEDFFERGGHSLLAVQLLARVQAGFGVELGLRAVFEHPTVAELARAIETRREGGRGAVAPPLLPRVRGPEAPLSWAQERLWFLQQLAPASPAYNIFRAIRLCGPLRLDLLERAFGEVLRRHETLRTRFTDVAGRPVQRIEEPREWWLPLFDLAGLPQAVREEEVRRRAQELSRLPFSLEHAPLLRVAVLRLGVEEHALLFALHHIVGDAWSMGALTGELVSAYGALAEGRAPQLPELPIQYADYALWQRQWLQGEVLEEQLAYWRRQLATAPEQIELPTDRLRPPVSSFRGAAQPLALPAERVHGLRALGRRQSATLFMTLLAAFAVLLHRLSRQSDVVVGTGVANRDRLEVENLIGFFANQIALRCDLAGNPSFAELLSRVRKTALDGFTHQHLPFQQVVEVVRPRRDRSRNPLFQVMLELESRPPGARDAEDATLRREPLELDRARARFDLTLFLSDLGSSLSGKIEYGTDLFERSTIERWAADFERLLADVTARPGDPVGSFAPGSEAERLQAAAGGDAGLIRGFRLSPQQRRAWEQERAGQGAVSQCVVRLDGPLDPARLQAALQQAVDRHEILRTAFPRPAGVRYPVQWIRPASRPQWREFDLAGEGELAAACREDAAALFDLGNGPVIRATLAALGAGEHALVLSLPLLSADARSLDNLVAEIARSYAQAGEPDEEVVQYVQFSEWQNELSEEATSGPFQHEDLRFPGEIREPSPEAWAPGAVPLALDGETVRRLEELALCLGVHAEHVLLACWQVLLGHATESPEPVVGVLSHGRAEDGLGGILGLLARWLPVSCPGASETAFRELPASARQALESCETESFFGPEAEEDSAGPRFAAGFEAPGALPVHEAAGLRLRVVKRRAELERFKVCLSWIAGSVLELRYDARVLPSLVARRLAGQLALILEQILERPETPVGRLSRVGPAERHRLLVELNDTATGLTPDCLPSERLAIQAAERPDGIALVESGRRWSFRELEEQVGRLAFHLSCLGVGPESRVALCLERSAGLVISILAVLRAGGAYVPLDPAAPVERLKSLLDDCDPRVILTWEGQRQRLGLPEERAVCLDRLAETAAAVERREAAEPTDPDTLAYVLYTSGSTGRPKGVMVSRSGLASYLGWAHETYSAAGREGSLLHSPVVFDLSVTSLFLPLLAGRPLVLLPEESGMEALGETLQGRSFDFLKLTPSHLEMLRHAVPQGVHGVASFILGGEELRGESLAPWRQSAPDLRIFNEYGPTETVVGCSVHEVPPGEPRPGPVPIGRPIANTRIYLLDREMQPVPEGFPGELCIAGAGVARGYFRAPERTAAAFVPDPHGGVPGARLYRTGDLARHLPDGSLEFLGRIDHQVKVRGMRIEPGEIEAQLAAHPAVREAVVTVREDVPGDRRLAAYFVPRDSPGPDPRELRSFLRTRLPEVMVPASFVPLSALPLARSGKVDRRALPAPGSGRPDQAPPFVAPETPREEEMARLWGEILRLETIGVEDNFFDLGGHSLLATQLLAKVRTCFGAGLSLDDFFRAPTVRGVTARVEEKLLAVTDQDEMGALLDLLESMGDAEARHLLGERES